MSNDNRINAIAVDINYKSTQEFFDGRGNANYINPLSATMYQDNQPQLVAERDRAEKVILAEHISSSLPKRVIELGCGIGRWSWFFAEISPKIEYLGVDFSASLITQAVEHARLRQVPNARFQLMSVTDIQDEHLSLTPPFDMIIISGLMLYLNDADCYAVLSHAARLCAKHGRIYLREPLATDERLTLKEFYSAELKQNYSAIYRTTTEMDAILQFAFPSDVFSCLEWKSPFGDELANRKETQQLYTLISHRGDK